MNLVLISTYELGRQPFGLASPAAWLRAAGHSVQCLDLSIDRLPENGWGDARLIAFYLPMHTAARLAIAALPKVRQISPEAHLCCYGLYAPLNSSYLRELGVGTILGGEFEPGLVRLAEELGRGGPVSLPPVVSLDRLRFIVPDRSDLAAPNRYSQLQVNGLSRLAGYTEASRGCKHMCRHCPVVPVYKGTFRVVQQEVVLEDVRRQVTSGAEHITFGDPDFLNGPGHARRLMEALHREFPQVTYDATIKIEHLRKHRDLLPVLRDTGCLFVTSAVESLDDDVLRKLDKGHTCDDFIEVVHEFRKLDLALAPTFIPFTPWTTLESYRHLLKVLLELDLVDAVSPVQLALRLLIPAGSLLLELDDVQAVLRGYDAPALLHRWSHTVPAIDEVAASAMKVAAGKGSRREIFGKFWDLANGERLPDEFTLMPRAAVPYLNEPWYC